jgi:hypothetical protein
LAPYLVYTNSRVPKEVIEVRPVGHATALVDKLFLEVNSRQLMFAGYLDPPSFREKGRVANVIITLTCFCFAL